MWRAPWAHLSLSPAATTEENEPKWVPSAHLLHCQKHPSGEQVGGLSERLQVVTASTLVVANKTNRDVAGRKHLLLLLEFRRVELGDYEELSNPVNMQSYYLRLGSTNFQGLENKMKDLKKHLLHFFPPFFLFINKTQNIVIFGSWHVTFKDFHLARWAGVVTIALEWGR